MHTIRAWEKRYQAVSPRRNSSGRRIYSDKEVERLSMLSELCSLGHSIGHIANWPTEELKENLEKLGRIKSSAPMDNNQFDFKIQSNSRTKESLENLILALRHYKLDIISHEFNKLKLVLNPRQFALDILSPLMFEVGSAISESELTLSQEQALMSLIRFHIGSLIYRQVQHKSKRPLSIIMSTPEGCYDDLPIMISALLCVHYNLSIYYLGPNLPLSAVLDAYKSVDATHMIIGVSPRLDKSNKYLDQYTRKLCSKISVDDQVIIQGDSGLSQEMLSEYKNLSISNNLNDLDSLLKKF